MQLFHLYNEQGLHKLAHSKFWQFEFSIWLHVFARSMISVFVPVILLQAGYSLSIIMLFYALLHLFDVPLNFLASKFIQEVGAKMVLIASTFFAILFFVILNQINGEGFLVLAGLALVGALYDSFYWVSHLYLFLESEEPGDDQGVKTSILYIVKRLAVLLGPAIGAFILIFGTQNLLVIGSIIFFALSAVPLLHIDNMKDKPKRKPLSLGQFLKHPREKRSYISNALFGIHRNSEAVIWPLFIYVIFESIQSVAYVPIIVSITAMIFSYFIGRLTKTGATRLIIIGSVTTTAVWILRLTTENPTFYYISIFLIGLFSLLISLPLDSEIFRRGRKIDSLSASLYRNVFSMSPRIPYYFGLYLALDLFKTSFMTVTIVLFVLIIINTVFMLYKNKYKF